MECTLMINKYRSMSKQTVLDFIFQLVLGGKTKDEKKTVFCIWQASQEDKCFRYNSVSFLSTWQPC